MRGDLPIVDVAVTPDTRRFWDELAGGRFTVPWCESCDDVVWYPRPICPRCLTVVDSERTLSGAGTVYSFSVVHKGPPPFGGAAPYVLAYVSLDGGPTVLSNLVGEALTVEIGDQVRLMPAVSETGAAAIRFELAPCGRR